MLLKHLKEICQGPLAIYEGKDFLFKFQSHIKKKKGILFLCAADYNPFQSSCLQISLE